jgi:3-hydroxyisobutyrate dehydrogenase-like beta-hydroxyacid dehydrogenase
VAPTTKRAAAEVIGAAGGRYVDAAIMSPVKPAALAAPLLLSGAHARDAEHQMRALGFSAIRCVGAEIGRASRIKMIRSVLIKGIEALTAECLVAAESGGVVDEVLASLGGTWPQKANYNLERMLSHGGRRAAELEEVALTLRDMGIDPAMTQGAIQWQRQLGALGVDPAPASLAAKLSMINTLCEADAA